MRGWLQKLFSPTPVAAPDAPAFWKSYIQSMDQLPESSTPLQEVPFVVLDTETTGFDARQDKVLSVGAVKVQGGQVWVSESFACLVRQEVALGNKSPEVHGLLRPQLTQEGLPEQEALAQLLRFCGNAVLVGHHIGFDLAMVNVMVRRCGIHGKLLNPCIDTAQLARRLEQPRLHPDAFRPADYTLDALISKYNLPSEARHTAPGDAFMTAILLLKLLAKARKRGIMTVRELVG